MKKVISFTFLFLALFSFAQNADTTKTKVKVYGSFERNGQWYTNDKNRGINQDTVPLRANNYFNVNFNYKKFTVGTQVESYMNEALLNFNPKYKGTNFATYYATYKTKKLDITLGHYYVQFGSGLALRTWEDRSLGINNALRGAKVVYSPIDEISFTALYGKTRSGFDVANSDVFGFNTDVNVSQLLNLEAFDLKYGFSGVSRYEELPVIVQNFSAFTNLFSNRFELGYKNYYVNTEYVFKSNDAFILRNNLNYDFIKPGNALLLNFGYSKKGIGFDTSLRRIENMQFLSERQPQVFAPEKTSINFNDRIIIFLSVLSVRKAYLCLQDCLHR